MVTLKALCELMKMHSIMQSIVMIVQQIQLLKFTNLQSCNILLLLLTALQV